jgi:NAD(P)-dependent dehydrogenase (short-subunit alcohol dehydrogenase family)
MLLQVGPKVVDVALKSFTQIDSLIINHGVLTPVKRVVDFTPEEWRSVFDINFFSAIALVSIPLIQHNPFSQPQIKPALPALRKSHGRIIFTSSGAAVGAYSGWGAYGSSKAAMNHLGLTLSVEEPDITSVAIRPGVVDTDMQKEVRGHADVMDATDAEKFRTLHETGKTLRPEQPGDVIARLAVGAEKELSGKFLR